jgi:hypothetical protein
MMSFKAELYVVCIACCMGSLSCFIASVFILIATANIVQDTMHLDYINKNLEERIEILEHHQEVNAVQEDTGPVRGAFYF